MVVKWVVWLVDLRAVRKDFELVAWKEQRMGCNSAFGLVVEWDETTVYVVVAQRAALMVE